MTFQFTNTADNRAKYRIPYWFACELARIESFASQDAFEVFWDAVTEEVFHADETMWHTKGCETSKKHRAEFANRLFEAHNLRFREASHGFGVGMCL